MKPSSEIPAAISVPGANGAVGMIESSGRSRLPRRSAGFVQSLVYGLTGLRIEQAGLVAAYGALARYAFDVGGWENSRWTVFHGASGHPGSPHYADQHAVWAGTAMVPMTYGWDALRRTAPWQQELA